MSGPAVWIRTKVALPKPPNFIRFTDSESAAIDVAALTDDELRQIGAAWTEALLLNAYRRREDEP